MTSAACFAADTNPIEELAPAGSTGLRYDAQSGQFIFNWKTPKQPNACYDVNVIAADGAALPVPAHFKLN